jgi:hypothetical protein
MAQKIIYVVWDLFKVFVLIFGSLSILYFLLVTFKNYIKHRKDNSLKEIVLNHRYVKVIDFVKWVIYDLFSGKDYFNLFGMWAFTGYYGEGKTTGCVMFAKHLQNKNPNKDIKLYSNINLVGQEKRITDWEELLDLPPNSIFIYDESQNDYSCNMKEFPEEFLRKITQQRKKQFAMFMTSPRFNRMNINIRESVNFVIECKNLFHLDRWFAYDFYNRDDYEEYRENRLKLRLSRKFKVSFVMSNKDYSLYDTKEEVRTIKGDDKKVAKKEEVSIKNILKDFKNELLKEVEYRYLKKE